MAEPRTIKWGIMATGGIARTFVRNLLRHKPEDRGTFDLKHVVAGVASSSSLENAQVFIDKNVSPYQTETHNNVQCTPHASYLSLIESLDVDVVYIATPHTMHYSNAMLCLTHGKPVLVEKPMSINASQAGVLVAEARKRNLFLMEGVWTRFFPIAKSVHSIISNGVIGEVIRINADFSIGAGDDEGVAEMFPGGDENRILNPTLGGGVLLDLGVYSLNWVFMCVHNTLPRHLRPDQQIESPYKIEGVCVTRHPRTNVDESTTILLSLPSSPTGSQNCHAVASTSLRCSTDPAWESESDGDMESGADKNQNEIFGERQTDTENGIVPFVRIQGTNGEVQVFGSPARPQILKIFVKNQGSDKVNVLHQPTIQLARTLAKSSHTTTISRSRYSSITMRFPSPGDGNGMYWEADEVGRCLKNGQLESDIMPWDESIMILRLMDQVREKSGIRYDEALEMI